MTDGPILITGASGVVGRAVCRALSGKNMPPLVCLSRNMAASPERNASWVNGSLDAPEAWGPSLEGVDVAVHLALREPAAPAAESARLHVEGTRALVEACRAAGVPRLWMLSSVHARTAAADAWAWAKSLRDAEALVRDSGLAWGVVRVPLLLGPRVPSAQRLAALARWPLVPLAGATRVEPLALDDLAATLARVAREPGSEGEAHELGGGRVLPLAELLTRLRAARGASAARCVPALRGLGAALASRAAAGWPELEHDAEARAGALAEALGDARTPLDELLAAVARA